ncbi:MAG: hypothetical protein JO276_13725 [Sphingomonadaceae bacterium]|nr:hypothetical protein [Sphingomonadaceae bacterium]
MSTVIGARAPAWLRIVAALGLIWNCMGVYAYLATVGVVKAGGGMAMAQMPAWVTGAFAISVFGGLLGCLGLVLLKRWAKLLLLLSFLALLAQDVWKFAMTAGPADNLPLTAAVNLIAILLVWLAYSADSKGWLS